MNKLQIDKKNRQEKLTTTSGSQTSKNTINKIITAVSLLMKNPSK